MYTEEEITIRLGVYPGKKWFNTEKLYSHFKVSMEHIWTSNGIWKSAYISGSITRVFLKYVFSFIEDARYCEKILKTLGRRFGFNN